MSRYRKVEVKIYSDEKFRRLSSVQPSGQSLFLYLITGPHTTSIPGLFCVGRAALAEKLGWDSEAFAKAFDEVFREGMAKADWSNLVVWIPNAIRHNEPASPNVVKSWAVELGLIPDCALKAEAVAAIARALDAMNPAFSEAFAALLKPSDTVPKPSRKPSAKPLPKTRANQEQEQEQQQEETETLALTSLAPVARPVSDSDAARVYEAYPRKVGRAKALEAIRGAVRELSLGKQLPPMDADEAMRFLHGKATAYARSPAGNAGKFTPHPATWFNQQRYFDDGKEWEHGSAQENKPIAAVERQRVTHNSIRATAARRYGISLAEADDRDAGAVSPGDAARGNTGHVPGGVGANDAAVRSGAVSGRVIDGHR